MRRWRRVVAVLLLVGGTSAGALPPQPDAGVKKARGDQSLVHQSTADAHAVASRIAEAKALKYRYRANRRLEPGRATRGLRFRRRCLELADAYERLSRDTRALSELHRQMAADLSNEQPIDLPDE